MKRAIVDLALFLIFPLVLLMLSKIPSGLLIIMGGEALGVHFITGCLLMHAFIKKRNASMTAFQKRVAQHVSISRKSILQEVSVIDESLEVSNLTQKKRRGSKRKRRV